MFPDQICRSKNQHASGWHREELQVGEAQKGMAAVAVGGAASSGDTGNACKRLQKELMALMMSTDDGISAFPDSDNMLLWCCARPKALLGARPCLASTRAGLWRHLGLTPDAFYWLPQDRHHHRHAGHSV